MARPKGNYSLGDEPSRQPMRPAARGQIARNPSSDQKRQRRQMQRSAEYTPGHVECESCGYTGHPVLGDGTAANCAHCGSYAVHKPQQGNRPAPAYPENSRHLNKGDYGITSSKTADAQIIQFPGTGSAPDGSISCPCHGEKAWYGSYGLLHANEGWTQESVQRARNNERDRSSHEGAKTAASDPVEPGRNIVDHLHNSHGDSYEEMREFVAPYLKSHPHMDPEDHLWHMHSVYHEDNPDDDTPCNWDADGGGRDYSQPNPFGVYQRHATILHSKAWQLNPGDQIRLPNGRTQKVTRVRQHETSQGHVYVDTDGGRALAKRDDLFEVVPHNSAQLGTPGWGTPGGNTEMTPGGTPHETAMAPSTQCPTCGRNGSLRREGDHYVCSHCGYREQFGGPSGHALSESPRQYQVAASYSTINGSTKSAVARRAEAVLNQKENQ